MPYSYGRVPHRLGRGWEGRGARPLILNFECPVLRFLEGGAFDLVRRVCGSAQHR